MDIQSLPWYAQFGIFLLIGGIAFGVFYFTMYSGTQDQIKGLTTQINQLEEEIRIAEKKESMLKQLQAEVKKKEAVLGDLREILPEENEIAGIIKKIESIIADARLKVQRWTSPVERQKEIYVQHEYTIDLDGTYHNLGVFLDQLSKIKKIFNISSLSIRPYGGKSAEYVIKSTVKASTYTYKERKVGKKKKKRRKK